MGRERTRAERRTKKPGHDDLRTNERTGRMDSTAATPEDVTQRHDAITPQRSNAATQFRWVTVTSHSLPNTRTNGSLTPSQRAMIYHQFVNPLKQKNLSHPSFQFVTFAQISTRCCLAESLEVPWSQQRSSFNQISDVFSRFHDLTTLADRARCLAHGRHIFNECCRCR